VILLVRISCGEITNCLFRFLSLISSKTNLISFPLKFVLKFSGKLIFNVGTIVSFVIVPPLRNSLLRQAVEKYILNCFQHIKLVLGVTKEQL
jgi:hypothetical protein